MTNRMEGKVAVVTGGGRGIGRAIATAYAREGAAVAIAARSEDQLETVAEEIRDAGGDAVAVATDITNDRDVEHLRERVEDELGPCDVLVNNAGIHRPAPFLDYSMDDWEHIVGVNLFGTVRVTRTFLPGMLHRRRGKILNVASTAGKYGGLFQSPYNSSKHGVVGLTRCLALETAKAGVRVNAICPGFVATDMVNAAKEKFQELLGLNADETEQELLSRVPIGRFLDPHEVGHLAVYLASNESDGVTGQAYTISGGMILV